MKTRRILSLVLALMFVLSTFTFASISVSAATPEVYVDFVNGNDGAKGTQEAPLKTIDVAFSKVDDGGTVYLLSDFEIRSYPATTKFITVSGVTGTERLTCPNSDAVIMNGPLKFENIQMPLGTYAHLNANGYKLVLGEGFVMTGTAQIHASRPGTNSTGEHFVIEGADVTSSISLGGAYHTNPANGVMGDVTMEVVSGGTLATLKVTQDGYTDGMKNVTITGNVNVRVGKDSAIKAMSNQGRAAVVNGYFQLIVEENGSMCELDLTNFVNKEIYEIRVADTTHGQVNFTSTAGVFEIVADDGYVVEYTIGGEVAYGGAGLFEAPLGQAVTINFTDSKKLAPSEVDVIVEPATPGETEWPVAVSDTAHFNAVTNAVTPDHATVGYAIPYTYEISLKANEGYVFPGDFAFTINGSSEYRIEVLSETYDEIVFIYTADLTAKDETRNMISYVGGIGTAGTAPYNAFADKNSVIVVGEQYFTQGGYNFVGYSDGTNIYQPGDDYQLGEEDVVFTAVWELLNKTQVVFNGGAANGGFAPDALENYEGMYVTIPANTFAYTGYSFVNWTDEDGKVYNPGDLVLLGAENLYLTANWEVNPNAGVMVYVDVLLGDDSNDGLTPETAVATLAKAVALAEGGNVTVIVIGDLSIAGELPANDGYVTITGYDTDAALLMAKPVIFSSATTIENIAVNASEGTYFVTNGYESVIGPNLTNLGVAYDVVDGAVDGTVEMVDTIIKDGVTIDNYYLGGADLSANTKGISGNVNVTIDGANINVIDFAPKGETPATISGHLIFNVNAGDIGSFIATTTYVINRTKPAYIFFNNGTIPELEVDVVKALKNGRPATFVFDSGIGGAIEVSNYASPSTAGAVSPVAGTENSVWYSTRGAAYKELTKATFNGVRVGENLNTITKVRYGDKFTDDIEATIVAPTGGAEAFSITATPVDESITDLVSIQLSGWDPELIDGKFSYETAYTANVLISLKAGNFFDTNGLPAVILNDEVVETKLNPDGSLSATYTFPGKTGIAPQLNVTFDKGDDAATGNVPAAQKWDHMSVNSLPYATSMSNLGYRFAGWKCSADNKIYRAGANYALSGNVDVVFTATWSKRGEWELPNVLILYDLSALGKDKGRNPKFDSQSDVIEVSKPFAALEYDINGTKGTVWSDFDNERVVALKSDGAGKGFCINDYTLNRTKADPTVHKYVTIVYYYESTDGKAVGQRGSINFGNVILADVTKSNWYGKGVEATETVVANKWACMVWDLTQVVEENAVPAGSVVNQFHIYPIGRQALTELKGDTLYLKAMYFSKTPATIR